MKKRKILFFDIDHTLYDPDTKSIPKSTYLAFEKLSARQDTIIGIATGRAFYMLDIIEPLKPFIHAYITINGQIVTANDTLLHDEMMSKDTIYKIKETFNDFNLTFGFIGKDSQAINRLDADTEAMFKAASIPLPIENPHYDEHHEVYQMWAFANEKMFEKVALKLPNYQLVPWLSDGFDVILGSRSKRDGVEKILEHYQLSVHDAYCFGDGDNDLEMLAYIPQSFAMGNAKKNVKQCAKYTIKPLKEDGIYLALKELGLID